MFARFYRNNPTFQRRLYLDLRERSKLAVPQTVEFPRPRRARKFPCWWIKESA